MPRLVRFLLVNAAIGFSLAFVFVGLLLAFDFEGLRTLMLGSEIGYIALFMFTFFTGLTTASIQIGVATMLLGETADDDDNHPHAFKRLWWALRDWFTFTPERAVVKIPVKKGTGHQKPTHRGF